MVSIIIPTLNRFEQLTRTLNSLTSLKTNRTLFEIIVVDNGSVDDTRVVIEEFISKYCDLQIKYFFDDTPGLLTGRHKGAKESSGDILTFIDDDIQVSPNWLNTIIEVLKHKTEFSFLTGPNFPLYESYPPDWLEYFWSKIDNGRVCSWLSLLDFGSDIIEIDPNFVWGLNFTVRKDIFYKLGGFHPDNISKELQHFQGDGETGLTIKAKKTGYRALYHPDVFIYHEVTKKRMTIEYFEKRAYYQGICNSFSDLREKENNKFIQENKEFQLNKQKYLSVINFRLFDRFCRKKQAQSDTIPFKVRQYLNILHLKEKEGYNFHQEMYSKNEKVRLWVQKDNFIDYKLPNYDTEDYR